MRHKQGFSTKLKYIIHLVNEHHCSLTFLTLLTVQYFHLCVHFSVLSLLPKLVSFLLVLLQLKQQIIEQQAINRC